MIEVAPQIVIDIINEELQHSEFSDIQVSEGAYFVIKIGDEEFIQADDPDTDFASLILDRVSTNRFGSSEDFYHFKSAERIIEVLRQKTVYATNLPAHNDNDNAEFVAWIVNVLDRKEWLLREENPWQTEFGPLRIDDWRAHVHILCLTRSIRPWMWSTYGGTVEEPATGGALVFGFEEFDESETELLQPLYDFRDVFYDNESGDRFGFLHRIDERIYEATGQRIMFEKMLRFAKLFKGYGFRNELEARLAFDSKYVSFFGRHLDNHYDPTYYPKAEKPWGHISLPLFDQLEPRNERDPIFLTTVHPRSPSFKIVLRRVVLGENMTETNKIEIRRFVALHFPSATIEED